jgi:hypothetical protein
MKPTPSAAPPQGPGYGFGGGLKERELKQSSQQPYVTGDLAVAAGGAKPQSTETEADSTVPSPASAFTVSDKSSAGALQAARPPVFAGQEFARAPLGKVKVTDYGSNLPDPGAVMVSFKLEQAGQEVRVVDRDGSVYTGPLEFSARPDLFSRRLSPQTAPALPGTTGAVPGYSFKLIGTNRTLNQRVVFTGMLLPTNSVLNLSNLSSATASSPRTAARGIVPPLNNARVSGRLLVGDSTVPIEIDALPVKPGPSQ